MIETVRHQEISAVKVIMNLSAKTKQLPQVLVLSEPFRYYVNVRYKLK